MLDKHAKIQNRMGVLVMYTESKYEKVMYLDFLFFHDKSMIRTNREHKTCQKTYSIKILYV